MTKPRWLLPPDDLPESAAKYWEFYAPGLHKEGRLTSRNVLQFRQLCVLAAIIDAAAVAIGADGISFGRAKARRGGKGASATVHPVASVMLVAQKQLAPLLAAFRLDRPDGDFRL